MVKRIVTLFVACIFGATSFSKPNVIEEVRASNAYSEAKKNYLLGEYRSAFSDLKIARENLKGTTNPDLEFMEIMTKYRLKNYTEAYEQLLAFFESPPWVENQTLFKNIETLDFDGVEYADELTAIFSDLENRSKEAKEWAEIRSSVDPVSVAKSAAQRLNKQLESNLHELKSNLKSVSRSYNWEHDRSDWLGYTAYHTYNASAFVRFDGELSFLVRADIFRSKLSVDYEASRTPNSRKFAKVWGMEAKYENKTEKGSLRGSISTSFYNDRFVLSVVDKNLQINGLHGYVEEKLEKTLKDVLDFRVVFHFNASEKTAYKVNSQTFKKAFLEEFSLTSIRIE